MSSLRFVIYGEGPHELGSASDDPRRADDCGALPRLVHRLLGRPGLATYRTRTVNSMKHIHLPRASRLARKVAWALIEAKRAGDDAAVVVVDRDRQHNRDRIDAMRQGRDDAARKGCPPCVVGTAIETFDAWMIADGKAIGAAGGDGSISHPDPEKLDGKEGTGQHPKDRAARVFGGGGGLGHAYAAVAASVDIGLLKQRCPQGFTPFAADVETHLLPVVRERG